MTDELHREVAEHFNEPMLAGFDLVRCIGYGEDDSDCYVIYRRPGGEVIWHTMVGGYTFLSRLKGQGYARSTSGEDWDDLFRLDHMLALNGCPKEAVMRVELRDTSKRPAKSLSALLATDPPSPPAARTPE